MKYLFIGLGVIFVGLGALVFWVVRNTPPSHNGLSKRDADMSHRLRAYKEWQEREAKRR